MIAWFAHHVADCRQVPLRPLHALRCLILAILLVSGAVPAGAAGDRVALVIGMGDYEQTETVGTLDNTIRDAAALSRSLEGIGFEVTQSLNTPLKDLIDVLNTFAFRSETADLALIYFAGHGVQVQGENFLLPVDVNPRSNEDLRRQSVSLNDLLAVVDRARRMRIVILDACRNNPFGTGIDLVDQANATGAGRSLALVTDGNGLAPVTPERGTLVAFAARDGDVALDGNGLNSPFATALIDQIPEPGVEISLMFRKVRDQVLRETGNAQEPYSYGSLPSVPFYLAGPGEGQSNLSTDPIAAWSSLRPEDEPQLIALADQGNTRSMVGLAYKRLNPAGDFQPEVAVTYLRRAADAGDPIAQFELAKLYEKGIGVEVDEVRALELFQAAAAQDLPEALNDLGFMHYHGALGLPRSLEQALKYFERAADQRDPEAQFNFAALIDDKLVPSKGPEDAGRYLYAALRSGSSKVLSILQTSPNMFTPETRQSLQRRLQEVGFYSGAIDGSFGPGTNRGLRQAYGLEE